MPCEITRSKGPTPSKESHIGSCVRPSVSGNLGSVIESVVLNCDRPPGAFAKGPNNEVTTYACSGLNNDIPMAGAYVRASTGDAQAHVGPMHARANGPAASAGAHASILGASVGANAELCRAEASVAGITAAFAPNVNTGASIGPDGVSASFLGFGFDLGPRVGVKTPVGDLKCSIM